MSDFTPLRFADGTLHVLDQLALPGHEAWLPCDTAAKVGDSIRNMNVRGAPAIGIAAAYGVAIASRAHCSEDAAAFVSSMDQAIARLSETRPTAVNLFWALERVRKVMADALASGSSPADVVAILEADARAIHAEDLASCKRIGQNGADLMPDEGTVLTHCNAGALATGGYGTALGVLRAGREAGKKFKVLADETRPYLQGARLTAWELVRDGFDVTVIPDSAAAFLIARGRVDCAIVGADRIAANGDVANKIGTYAVALAARAAGMPFYVAAPASTIDLATQTGADIPIEMRAGDEVLSIGERRIAPDGVEASYPAFDITAAELITAIITDSGVARPPYTESLPKHA